MSRPFFFAMGGDREIKCTKSKACLVLIPLGEGHGAEGALGILVKGSLLVEMLLQGVHVGQLHAAGGAVHDRGADVQVDHTAVELVVVRQQLLGALELLPRLAGGAEVGELGPAVVALGHGAIVLAVVRHLLGRAGLELLARVADEGPVVVLAAQHVAVDVQPVLFVFLEAPRAELALERLGQITGLLLGKVEEVFLPFGIGVRRNGRARIGTALLLLLFDLGSSSSSLRFDLDLGLFLLFGLAAVIFVKILKEVVSPLEQWVTFDISGLFLILIGLFPAVLPCH